jgi:dolichol-phosphate mannosyltransferase
VAREHGARVVAGAPLPPGWAGKPWALEQGLRAARGDWIVFLDADTRPKPGLIRALVEAAAGVDVLSAGARFVCETPGERLLHPSFLATLVYRVGPADDPTRPIANGQCVVARREALLAAGGWARVGSSLVDDLLEVRMYEGARETWHGWGRSLIERDRYAPGDLAVVWLTMALPLPRLLLRRGDLLDVLLVAQRFALLVPLARAYRRRGLAFWLSPLADVATALRLTWTVTRPSRSWRGRTYGRGTGRRSAS